VALDILALPFGLRDVKIFPLTGEVAGPGIDFPNARTLSYSETEDFEELRGDDGLQAIHGNGATMDWDLEGGGLPLEAVRALYGGTITETGTTPNQVKTYSKADTDARPYVKIIGQAYSDSGGDVHGVLYRAKATGELSGEMADGSFWMTGASGRALPRASDRKVYDFVQHETATAIATAANEQQRLSIDATGGTFTLTYSGQTSGNIAFNASAGTIQTALEALSNIGVGDVSVSGSGGVFVIVFTGALAGTNVAQLVASSASLTGASASAAITTLVAGG
jgi:hypothetical protein